jgi:type IV pilus assembly protein PilM
VAEAVSMSGLSCDILDVSGFALANCFEKNYGTIKGQSLCLLNIGSTVTNFVIIENGEVVFCRDIPVGGGHYTAEIQKGMGISFEEAESMKLSSSMGQPVPEEVAAYINQTHEAIVEEIGNSIEFYLSTSQGSPVSQCFVTGGGAKTAGLVTFMARTIKFPCEIFDQFLNIKFNEKTLNPQYIGEIREFAAVAMGLGLRRMGDA